MKKWLSFLLALVMVLGVAGCQRGEGEPVEPEGPGEPEGPVEPVEPVEPEVPEKPINAPRFTAGELPRMDGSTATAPLAAAMVALMLGVDEAEAEQYIHFNRTTNSYYNLLYDNADLLIVSEGNEEVYSARQEMGFEWEQTPFALDAFVFVVNAENPVDSITVDEARRIYAGEITNWSELGGQDLAIVPLQRNPEAGSQSLMEKLVMRGTPMMEAPKEYVIESMGGLMEAVRGYDASAGAIGYSVYYYAEEMRAAEGLKLLKLEGVEPEPETIRSGAYPLVNPYYVVIAADEPLDAPARIIRNWLLDENGQRLAAREGYVPVMDYPTADRETLPAVGTRLFDTWQGELVPGSYPELLPYAGLRLTDNEFAETGCLYGLMTPGGAVAVDPVYADVWVCGDLLVLTRGIDGEKRMALAARNGAWVTEYEYLGAFYGVSLQGLVLFTGSTVTLIHPDGEVEAVLTPADMGITQQQFDTMRLGAIEGGGGDWLGDKLSVAYDYESEKTPILYYDLTARQLKRTDTDAWYASYPSYEPEEEPAIPGAYYLYDSIDGEDAPALLALYGENAVTYYREDGTPLPELTSGSMDSFETVRLMGGLVERLERNTATYYDLDTMQVVFRTYLGYEGD